MEVPTLLNIYTLYCVHCILCTLYIIQIFSNPNSNAAFQRSNICDLVSLYYFSSKAILKCSIALLLRLQVLCICVEQRQSNKVGAALLKRSPLSPPLSHTKVPLPLCVPPPPVSPPLCSQAPHAHAVRHHIGDMLCHFCCDICSSLLLALHPDKLTSYFILTSY